MIRNSRNYISDHLATKQNKSHEMLANVTPHVTQSQNVPYTVFTRLKISLKYKTKANISSKNTRLSRQSKSEIRYFAFASFLIRLTLLRQGYGFFSLIYARHLTILESCYQTSAFYASILLLKINFIIFPHALSRYVYNRSLFVAFCQSSTTRLQHVGAQPL